MIKPLSYIEATRLHKILSTPKERLDVYFEFDEFDHWISEITAFISSKDTTVEFGIEKYKADIEFFTLDNTDLYPLIFMSKFVPSELVFFGVDWQIGISSYPEEEYSSILEYGLRFCGAARILGNR